MSLKDRLLPSHTEINKAQAEKLQHSANPGYTVEIRPPRQHSKDTLPRFIRTVQELQTQWLGLKNSSPITSYEIRRTTEGLTFQLTVPTKRLERKVRSQLTNTLPDIKFGEGSSGLPVKPETTVGGGLLTTGELDHYPLETDFDEPPTNTIAKTLHRHSMRDTGVVIQVLFRPVVGNPLWNKYWTRRAYQRVGFLRKEKEKLWGSRPPTPREKRQANAIEDKTGNNRFQTSIRFAVIGAGEHTKSRVKEISGAFNIYENPDTGQYFNTTTIQPLREHRLVGFANSIADRRFDSWASHFQTTVEELAALTAVPSTTQENIRYASP